MSTPDEPAYGMLQEAQQITKTFLSEFSTNQLQSLFPAQTAKNHPIAQANVTFLLYYAKKFLHDINLVLHRGTW